MSDVGLVPEQVRGDGMPEGVRGDPFSHSAFPHRFGDDQFQSLGRQPRAVHR